MSGTTLVTGSTGFVGAHVVRAVAERGGRVVAADLTAPPAEVLALWDGRDVEFRHLDVRVPQAVFTQVRPDVVVHAAAVTNGSRRTLQDVNVGGTAAVLEAAGPAHVVHVSSASVYADSTASLHENSPVRTNPGPYAASKLAAEQLAAAAGAVIARVAACYGPLERDTTTRRVMSLPFSAVRAALAGQAVRADPESAGKSFDPTWVGDVAEGIAALAATPDPPHQFYNVGSGEAVTLADLADAVTAAVGAPPSGAPFLLRLPDGHRTGVLDVTRLRALPVPEPTPLRAALSTYLDWLRDHAC
ncbi:NAD-dependent epimerase/dehydratase family protein [Amycolatopsis sp. NPDC051903]|uniref:NAD-dependent epimerase/dehydratase family protein n=1 Tax=Amycolatopsis sp. NPDC051903 TaxID=3363936 RepID=UPI003787BB68